LRSVEGFQQELRLLLQFSFLALQLDCCRPRGGSCCERSAPFAHRDERLPPTFGRSINASNADRSPRDLRWDRAVFAAVSCVGRGDCPRRALSVAVVVCSRAPFQRALCPSGVNRQQALDAMARFFRTRTTLMFGIENDTIDQFFIFDEDWIRSDVLPAR
jgi:hypothetical protein